MTESMDKEKFIKIISGCMMEICDQNKHPERWEKEADALIGEIYLKDGKAKNMKIPDDLADLLDLWQNKRIEKDSDFPLKGMN